jgi:HK97 family phage portal protein
MTGKLLNLEAVRHESRVLNTFLAGREGGAGRAGVNAALENATTTNLNANELASILGLASMSSAGVAVTRETAIRVSTVYGCVQRLAGSIASLPFEIYEREGNAKKLAPDHPYWWMLNEQANPDMTASTAWKLLISGQLFYGDGYAELLRPHYNSSRVIGWRPLHPLRVVALRDDAGRRYWRVQPIIGEAYILDQADIIHLPSLGYDDELMRSPSPITYAAREQIGSALAGDAFAGKFFTDGANFDYALKTASNLSKQQLEDLRISLQARRAGARNPLILTGGLEPAQLSVNAKDAEILATRLFNVEEICRIFGVPPHLVGHTEKNSSWGTGMAEQGGNYVRYTLMDRLTDIRQEFNRKLWPIRERYFVAHNTAELERGDMAARYAAYRIALGRAGEMPFMTADEVRRQENMPPNADLKLNPNGGNNAEPDQTSGQQQDAP